MKSVRSRSSKAAEQVNDAIHVLLLKLHLTRLGQWSNKLEDIHFLDLHLLSQAEHHPEDAIGDVRKVLQVPHSTLTSMIDRLEKRGLIRRAINTRDKRSYRLELTASGREVQREHHRVERLIAGRMLAALPDEKTRQEFVRLLGAMTQRLQAE
jgi:DNA-binding MarR family transcriptional regulator